MMNTYECMDNEIDALYVGEILMGYRYSSTLVRSLEWDIRKKNT